MSVRDHGVDGAAIRFELPTAPAREYPILTLAEASAAMDAAYEAKGRAASALKRARSEFNAASRALAQAEAAFRAAEERATERRAAKALDLHLSAVYGGGGRALVPLDLGTPERPGPLLSA